MMRQATMTHLTRLGTQRLTGWVCVALAIGILITLRGYPEGVMGDPGPRLMPMVIAWLLLPLGLVMALRRPPGVDASHEPPNWRLLCRAGLLLALTLGYAALLDTLGAITASVAFIFLGALVLGKRTPGSVLRYLMLALVAGGCLYALFTHTLQIALPTGLLL